MCLQVYVCTMCMLGAMEEWKKVPDPQKLDLWVTLSYHVNWVFYKSKYT